MAGGVKKGETVLGAAPGRDAAETPRRRPTPGETRPGGYSLLAAFTHQQLRGDKTVDLFDDRFR